MAQTSIPTPTSSSSAAQHILDHTDLHRRYGEGWVSVMDHGAAGDGTTDDAAAFQAAIDAVEAAGGGTVFIPEGTYAIGTRLTIDASNVSIRGAGWGSILKPTAAIIVFQCAGTVAAPLSGIHISDLAIDGNDTGQTDAGVINFNNTTNFTVERVYIYDTGAQVDGISASTGTTVAGGTGKGVVRDCSFDNLGKVAIYNSSGHIFLLAEGNTVTNGEWVGQNAAAITSGGKGASIVGNYISDQVGDGIQIGVLGVFDEVGADPDFGVGLETYIAGNTVRDCTVNGIAVANADSPSDATARNRKAVIEGNQVVDCATGILVQNSDNNIVRGNMVEGATSGISVDAADNWTVDSNHVLNSTTGLFFRNADYGTLSFNRVYTHDGGACTNSVLFQTTVSDQLVIVGNYLAGTNKWVKSVTPTNVTSWGNVPEYDAVTYTPTNVSTDRAYDADTVAVAELADVVGTLIADLQTRGVIG